MQTEEFKREVEQHLASGGETEPWELLYLKLYKSRLPVIEKALETAGLMLGNTESRGYCLEMICADFLAGVGVELADSDLMLVALVRLFPQGSPKTGQRGTAENRPTISPGH